MQYRRFGKLDWRVSALGFGAMRLPTLEDGSIDRPLATEMVRHAVDQGVNYIDTAHPYHSGESEVFVGEVLQDGYREKVRLATKIPCWKVEKREDFDRYFDEQLERLDMDRVDFYLLHALRKTPWIKVRDLGILDWAEKKMSDGAIGHLGFSFHDEYEVFQEIIDSYDGWTLCQIQYNYYDVDHQAGAKGLQYAASKGLAVVVMEPVRGGTLANPPEAVQELWDTTKVRRSPVDWALQWVWNQPEVSVALSGMSTMQHVVENLASADVSGPGALTSEELVLIEKVREKYQEICPVPCTGCDYCMPCPNDVNIPKVFRVYNEGLMFSNEDGARRRYERMKAENKASACIQCRECEDKCPQHIAIGDWMPEIHEVLGEGKPYVCKL